MTADRSIPRPEGARGPQRLGAWETRPRILITNDDGIEAPGLLALRLALEPLGDTFVMAPEVNESAVGHAKTYRRSLRVRERTMADGTTGTAVDGTPTDAVAVAILGYFGVGFDLVASGINEGANLAEDITYSGTVGAAIEGALLGVPALAVSRDWAPGRSFDLAADTARRAARHILELGLGERGLLNVNVPAIDADECEGISIVRMGHRVYDEALLERTDPRGSPYYWFDGSPPSGVMEPDTDVGAIDARHVAITPIHLDLTDAEDLERVRSWAWRAGGDAVDDPGDEPLDEAAVRSSSASDRAS